MEHIFPNQNLLVWKVKLFFRKPHIYYFFIRCLSSQCLRQIWHPCVCQALSCANFELHGCSVEDNIDLPSTSTLRWPSPRLSELGPKSVWFWLAPNLTNPGMFSVLNTESDLNKSSDFYHLGQSDPIRAQNFQPWNRDCLGQHCWG